MSSSFLVLTNRILKAFNEVNLTSSTFSSAVGFHAEAQDAINQAILDIYTFEDTQWPFAWSPVTFLTTIGTNGYTYDTSLTAFDWDSFRVQRATATASSLTQTSGTATFVSTSPHNFITGDNVTISGATPTLYNSTVDIVVVDSTTFTFSVDSTLASPATGTIIASSNTVTQRRLQFFDIDKYRNQYNDFDANSNSEEFSLPRFVIRKSDNNILLSPVPDRVYSIYYEGFSLPTPLVLYSDTSVIPTAFDQVIVDKALHYCYMFRDNLEQAALAQQRYEDNVEKMRRILIPHPQYVTMGW